jgi:hypothetical protein
MDPDPDPAVFIIDLKTPTKKLVFLLITLHHFSKMKSHEEFTKQEESRFFFSIFAW